MEDSAIDVVLDQGGPTGRSVRIPLEPFTLDRRDDPGRPADRRVPQPLRAGRTPRGLPRRTTSSEIVRRAARRLRFPIDDDAAALVSARSRGVPRVALRIQRRVRDLAQVRELPSIDLATASEGMDRLRIDALGLEDMDRRILRALIDRGEPTGLKTLAALVDESEDTLSEVFEPHLLRCGLIDRTPRGRVATRQAHAHLGIDAAPPPAGELPFEV